MSESLRNKSVKSFGWKFAQQLCTLGATFVIQLILARILEPADFGIVAITTVFMTLANTIIDTSFSSAVIQRASIDQNQMSSLFFANFGLSLLVYAVLFFTAPLITGFYGEPLLTPILRVQGLRVLFSAMYSIQSALLTRRMEFQKIFVAYLCGAIVQGVVGIGMAKLGFGIWALVISTVVNYLVAGLMIVVMSAWLPKPYFSYHLVKDALSFSSKVLVVSVVKKLFYNVRKIAMGKVYDSTVLGLFDKGFQFPSTIMTVVDGSLTQVAFTSLSKLQDNKKKLSDAMRLYVQMITYITAPMLLGMIMVAKPMVIVLLTEKWIECVPYLRIVCLTNLFVPLLVKSDAFNAIGRSDMSMKLNVSGIILAIVLLLGCIPLSPHVMVFSGFVSNLLLHIAIGVATKKEFGYTYREQVKDFFRPILLSLPMCAAIFLISLLPMPVLLKLVTEIVLGIFVYLAVSYVTKNHSFHMCMEFAKPIVKKYIKK